MKLTKILCPVDFSPGSRTAMRTAVRIATATSAELVLAHAWSLPVSYGPELVFPGDVLQDMVDDEERNLDDAVQEAKALGAAKVTPQFLTGAPKERLIDVLDSDAAFDLVVMGTHGRSGLSRFLLGSVAEQLVRHAPCSVMTVREKPERGQVRSILCPIDFSASSQHAVDLAAGLVEPGGTGITLLHVLDLPVPYRGETSVPGFAAVLDDRTATLLEDWATRLRAKVSVPVVTRSRIGGPGGQVLSALDETPGFDLAVVGSHGRTGIRRALLGSVAEKIVRHAPCPVLVARARQT